ncbi:unnamed protein product [Adineta ricciae]|uniref:Uncharacterized protein n=1 Tax=Adineta ricciae TaxID=249248 RepID=A0A814KR16_ADIRI|nr:unnamed protein product [Adineta ricciae]
MLTQWANTYRYLFCQRTSSFLFFPNVLYLPHCHWRVPKCHAIWTPELAHTFLITFCEKKRKEQEHFVII